jgi:tetratricopeptide (TPR) repeat protein
MSRINWYRQTTWTESDREAFFTQLNKSRKVATRDQYLRIQALYLQRVGTEKMLHAALELLDLLFQESPDSYELTSAYLQKANCLLALGDEAGAIAHFRKALQRENEGRSGRTTASLEFGWMIIERGLTDLYDEALEVVCAYAERVPGPIFAYQRYIVNAVRAVIANERGYPEIARECAQRALGEASQTHSGFRYHPKVGLVQETDNPVHQRLQEMVSR